MSAIDGNKYVYRILDTVGDGSGSIDQAVNGAVTSQSFRIKPAVTEKFSLERMNIVVAAANFNRANQYGGLALANGIRIYLRNTGGEIFDYTEQQKITAWPLWGLLAGSDVPTTTGVGSDALCIRWTFTKGTDRPLELVGAQGDELVVEINDDLSTLTYQYCMVQGYK